MALGVIDGIGANKFATAAVLAWIPPKFPVPDALTGQHTYMVRQCSAVPVDFRCIDDAPVFHEVGHTLGPRHSRQGVMNSRLGEEEVVAARSRTLVFRSVECERIARALRAEEATVAREHSPH